MTAPKSLSPDEAERYIRQRWSGKTWKVYNARLTVDHLVATYNAIAAGDTRGGAARVPWHAKARARRLLAEAGFIQHTVGVGWTCKAWRRG